MGIICFLFFWFQKHWMTGSLKSKSQPLPLFNHGQLRTAVLAPELLGWNISASILPKSNYVKLQQLTRTDPNCTDH